MILGHASIPYPAPDFSKVYQSDQENTEYRNAWKAYYQKYIHLNEETEGFIKKRKNELGIVSMDGTLGVHCRGTDYLSMKPHNHPVQPPVEKVIEKAKETMIQYGCERIILATEDKEVEKLFQSEFGNQLIIPFPAWDGYIKGEGFSRADISKREDGLIYLSAMALISQCPHMLLSPCGGSMWASFMSEDPISEYIFWDGLY